MSPIIIIISSSSIKLKVPYIDLTVDISSSSIIRVLRTPYLLLLLFIIIDIITVFYGVLLVALVG